MSTHFGEFEKKRLREELRQYNALAYSYLQRIDELDRSGTSPERIEFFATRYDKCCLEIDKLLGE